MAAPSAPPNSTPTGSPKVAPAKPGAGAMIKAELERLREAYEKQSKYWKWKSWIVAGYLALAGGSVVLALPPLNTLGAVVSVQPVSVGLETQYAAMVRNESGDDWSGVTVTFKGKGGNKQVFERPRVPKNGWFQTPGITWIPERVELDADQGSFTLVVPSHN